MARFVVLDHSLIGMGGHHFEQAVQILQAADRLGLEPVLAANMRFTQRHLLPPHWQVLTVFAEESHDCLADYPLDTRGLPLSTGGPEAGIQPAVRWPRGDSMRCGRRGGVTSIAAARSVLHGAVPRSTRKSLCGVGTTCSFPQHRCSTCWGWRASCKRRRASAKSCGMGCFTTDSCRGASRNMPNKRRWNARSVVSSNTCCSVSRVDDCDSTARRNDWSSNTIACR